MTLLPDLFCCIIRCVTWIIHLSAVYLTNAYQLKNFIGILRKSKLSLATLISVYDFCF